VANETEIRPFRVDMPDEAINDLRRRIAATRWPSKELVADRSQGVQLATLQELARYWAADYDWRRCETRLNALPQFKTEIDGVDVHFIHVKSDHADALPLIMTHGWPGSVIELLETVGPLTDPAAHGGRVDDAFHLVLPSIPGYGFSAEPAEIGWRLRPDRLRRRSSSRSATPRSPARSSALRAAGSRRATPPSPTSTRPARAATSLPGKSRNCSLRRSGRRSARCANDSPDPEWTVTTWCKGELATDVIERGKSVIALASDQAMSLDYSSPSWRPPSRCAASPAAWPDRGE
jgi:hypothetical protein